MRTRYKTLVFCALLSVLLLSSMAAGVAVQAAGNGQIIKLTSDPNTAPVSTPVSNEVFVEGYDVYVNEALTTPAAQITPGMNVWVRVRMADKRVDAANNPVPVVYLNTSSFVRLKPTNLNDSDANMNGGVSPIDAGSKPTGIKYEFVLPARYTGVGNTFAFDLSYPQIDGVPMFSYTFSLNQCVPSTSSSGATSDSTSASVRGTGFVMKSASYGDGDIRVGGSFSLSMVLLSTNGTTNVENVYVSITPSKEIALAGGNSVVYIGTVKPNQEVPVSFQLQAGSVETEGTYKVTIDVKGVNAATGEAVAAAMDIAIPVTFAERFEIFNVQVPDYLTLGNVDGTGYMSVTLVNKGKGIIHNVSAEVVGEGLSTQEGNQFVGNIAAGAQNSVDFTLVPEQTGDLSGQILIHYEDATGNEKTLKYDFSVTVEEMQDMPMPFPEEPVTPAQQGMPMWGWLLIGLGVAAAVVVVIVIITKRRKAKRNAALMDEYDEDTGDETV